MIRTITTITVDTKAIRDSRGNFYKTLILEGKEEKQSQASVMEILDKNCIANGASFEGRRMSASHYLGSTHKLPIALNPAKGIYLFPTAAITSKECVWIAYHQIKRMEEHDKNLTYIEFKDRTGIFINTSLYTLDNQKKRTSELIVQYNRHHLFFV